MNNEDEKILDKEAEEIDRIGALEVIKPRRAMLVGVYKGGKSLLPLCEEHLDELERLADTYGIEVAGKVPCPIRKYDVATQVGSGKLKELVEKANELQVDVVIFDDEIQPSQQRNLEKHFDKRVMDRTEVILEVFKKRANSREARIQVELARLRYLTPRLKNLWTHLHRQRGGMQVKGKGEQQIEIDRRLIRKRMTRLQKAIKDIASHRDTRRAARVKQGIPTFALVGYTNVGKSTLLNALTGAGVFVEDKLFATLDPTTRKFSLPNKQEILLVDTVGFIRKIPHHLVAAFKSTLEEAVKTDVLLHVIDVSHPAAEEQANAALEVLKELGAEHEPTITILNKIDQVENRIQIDKFRLKFPRTVAVSAINEEGFDLLTEIMIQELSKRRRIANFRIPQEDYSVVSEIMKNGVVHSQDYEGNDVLIRAEVGTELLSRYEKYVEA